VDLNSAFIVGSHSHSFACKLHHTCLYVVSVHQTAPLLVVADIKLQLTTHLLTPKR